MYGPLSFPSSLLSKVPDDQSIHPGGPSRRVRICSPPVVPRLVLLPLTPPAPSVTTQESLARARRLNAAGPADAEYGVSPFSDLTPEEFRLRHLSGRYLGGSRAGPRPLLAAVGTPRRPGPLRLPAGLPARVDWSVEQWERRRAPTAATSTK